MKQIVQIPCYNEAGTLPEIKHFPFLKNQLQKLGSWVVRRASKTDIPDAPSGFRILKQLPKFIFLSGLVFLAIFLVNVNDGVFFSGDGGVKYLMTKQMADGNFISYLQLEAPNWVKDLWASGFFPIEPPFIYNISDKYYIQYPLYFPFISSLWLFLFGFKGLYVLPAIGLILIWLGYILICRKYKIDDLSCAISLFALIFCSPLTLYGAMFWEHTLGVALLFLGILTLLSSKSNTIISCIAGLLVGSSIYLRPELIVLSGLFLIAVVFKGHSFELKINNRLSFTVGFLIALSGLFIGNYIFYGNINGLQADSVLEPFSLKERLNDFIKIFKQLSLMLVQHFPLIIPIILVAIIQIKQDQKISLLARLLLIISTLFIVLVPLLWPSDGGKQWGPRYLLGVLPIMTVSCGFECRKVWDRFGVVSKSIFGAILIVTFAYGFLINTIIGCQVLIHDYTYRVYPVYKYVVNDESTVIVVSHQWIAQELAATMKDKHYLLAKDGQQLDEIGKAAIVNNQKRILFITMDQIILNDNRIIKMDENQIAYMNITPKYKNELFVIHDIELGWIKK